MNKKVVGVGELIVSKNPDDLIITFALGSCLGVVIYDPVSKVGGMLHAMLPDASITHRKKEKEFVPAKFVNTGIPLLFKQAYKLGAEKKRLKVKLIGCSKILDDSDFFNIGKRNYAAARKLLWKNNVMVDAECCNNSSSISIFLSIETGELKTKISGEESYL
ncbi:MAG: chemotaxis protein CheD [bacterium]|nr:chemotaxis protein CheD [bacterium]